MQLGPPPLSSTAEASSGAYRAVLDLLAQMRSITKNPVSFDRMSDEMATLTLGYMTPSMPNPLPGARLTPHESKILHLLSTKQGHAVSHEAIYNALYFDWPECDQPAMKIIQVFICKLRQKIKSFQAPYAIETTWGEGYKLVEKSIA